VQKAYSAPALAESAPAFQAVKVGHQFGVDERLKPVSG
jgi:hypothetical protein